MKYAANISGHEFELDLRFNKKQPVAICEGREYTVDIEKIAEGHLLVKLNNRVFEILLSGDDLQSANVNGMLCDVQLRDARLQQLAAISVTAEKSSTPKDIKAPMPGMVLDLLVEEGQAIDKSTNLLIIEAMKMENEVRTGKAGVVKKIYVKKGQAVDKGTLLMRIEDQ